MESARFAETSVRVIILHIPEQSNFQPALLKPHFSSNLAMETTKVSPYGDWTMSWTTRIQFPAEARHFPLLHSLQTGCGAHPAIYQWVKEIKLLLCLIN
jgi:hypothetical protein